MKESIRRFILFSVIVITGSVLILFDVPLVIMIPFALMVGFILLVLLGAVSIEEIKSALGNLKPGNLKKTGILKRLDGMKFFKKSSAAKPDKKPSQKTETKQTVKAPEKVKGPEKKSGISGHLNSFVSSVRSLGTVLRQRSKHGKKVEDINKLLDTTVSEKIETNSARASAGNVADIKMPSPAGGAGSATRDQAKEQDPLLSLADDEFDTSILDSLDDQDALPSTQADTLPSLDIDGEVGNILKDNEPDIPLPSLDIDGEAGNILKDNAQGLEEFSSLDGGEVIDQDFGDLDGINLDDVDFGDDDEKNATAATSTSPAAAPAGKAASPLRKTAEVKTDWVKSDAPKGAAEKDQDQISTQADMAAFSSGPSSDADLLSSLADGIKHVEKKVDLSLLRELKDFKAPSSDIEKELGDMYARLKEVPDTGKKAKPPARGIK
jgi:hypothetical protein